MSYSPINPALFTAVYAGTLSGMGLAGRQPIGHLPATYAGLTAQAGAFAQSFDTLWGLTPTTSLDTLLAQQSCEAVWQSRAPIFTPGSLNPSTWTALAQSVIAVMISASLYYAGQGIVPPSVGDSVLVVFRPGAPSNGENVATWAEVQAAIASTGGLILVIIDNALAPAIVPAGSITECFGKTVFSAGNSMSAGAQLQIQDTAVIRNPSAIQYGLVVDCEALTTTPLVFDQGRFILEKGGVISNRATSLVACIRVLAPNTNFVLPLLTSGVLDNSLAPAVPVVDLDPNVQMILPILQAIATPLLGTSIRGGVTTGLQVGHDASTPVVPQSLFAGTFGEFRLDRAEALLPSAGVTASRPVLTDPLYAGQMYYDTTLNIPVWWTGVGAIWNDATGAPA